MNPKLKVILLSNYGSVISLGLFTPIYALFVADLGGSTLEAGTSAALFYLLAGALMILLRPLQDRAANRPKLMILGYLLDAATSLSLIFVNNLFQLYLIQIIHAFAAGVRIPSQRTLYAEHEDQGKEGSEWSILEGGDFLIMGVAAAFGGLIASAFNFDFIFGVMAGIQLTAGAYCSLLLRKQ